MIEVTALPALRDNYIWFMANGREAVVVDPGEPEPVRRHLEHGHYHLKAILLTHHHGDHTGGVEELLASSAGRTPTVYGPHGLLPHLPLRRVGEDDAIRLWPELELAVLAVPGHTLDHLAYWGGGLLFPGDTLFSAGCGRLFEGKAGQLFDSVERLGRLPGATRVYPGHEYTLANLAFAAGLEPDNALIAQYASLATSARMNQQPTLPTSIQREHDVNPFLRTREAAVHAAAERHAGGVLDGPSAVFTILRKWKDNFTMNQLPA
jgi:hydroxyacylglutathione hydrolase